MTTPDRGTDDLDAHAGTVLLVQRTLAIVADATIVTDRPIEDLQQAPAESVTRADAGDRSIESAQRGSRVPGRRPWRLLAAAAAVVLVAIVGGVRLRGTETDARVESAPAASSDLTPVTGDPVPSGDDAWLLPPRETSGLRLEELNVSRAYSSATTDGTEMTSTTIGGAMDRIGPLTFDAAFLDESSRTVQYRFQDPAAPRPQLDDPPLRITSRTNTSIEAGSVQIGDERPDETTIAGFTVVDAGELCAPDGQPQLGGWMFVAAGPCRHLYVASAGDLAITVDTDLGRDVGDLFATLRIVSIAELSDALAGVAGIEKAATIAEAPEPTMPPPTEVSIPDTVLCQSWANVLRHTAEPVELSANAAMFEDMLTMESASPPELAADIHLLAQMWSQTPIPPESADVMQRVMNGAQATCGFITLEPG